jgi:hypothetical protein
MSLKETKKGALLITIEMWSWAQYFEMQIIITYKLYCFIVLRRKTFSVKETAPLVMKGYVI